MCNFYVHVDSYTLLTLYSLEDTVGIPRATKMKQKSFFMVMFTGLIAGSTLTRLEEKTYIAILCLVREIR